MAALTQQQASALLNLPYDVDTCFNHMIENDGTHFKTPADEIIEIFEKRLNVSFTNDPDTFYKLAAAGLSAATGKELRTVKSQIKGWVAGGKPLKRTSAIQVCFALNMNIADASDFLRRAGGYPLNARDAHDAVYIYCLTNGKAYKDAEAMYKLYACAPTVSVAPKNLPAPGGNTTKKFISAITTVGNWATDDSFLKDFLIPNKSRFTKISNTAYGRYYHEKRLLQIRCISRALKEEQLMTESHEGLDYFKIYGHIVNNRSKNGRTFSEALEALAKRYPRYRTFYNNYQTAADRSALWTALSGKLTDEINAGAFGPKKEEVDRFLTGIMGYDALIREIVGGIPYVNQEFDYSESQFNSFFSDFLRQEYFTDTERNKTNSSTHGLRKMIVYTFFLNYIFEWEETEDADAKNSFGFNDFCKKLTAILSECQLSQLYPADQFDWLILKVIYGLQNICCNEDLEDALEVFYEILEKSFNQKSTNVQAAAVRIP